MVGHAAPRHFGVDFGVDFAQLEEAQPHLRARCPTGMWGGEGFRWFLWGWEWGTGSRLGGGGGGSPRRLERGGLQRASKEVHEAKTSVNLTLQFPHSGKKRIEDNERIPS